MADISAIVLAPDDAGSVPRKPQILSGTGSTETHTTTALSLGKMATLFVSGQTAVRLAFGSTAGSAGRVTTANIRVAPGTRFDWEVENSTAFVSAEAADGSSAYEVSVWTSSP